ncbi:MAG: tRNA adenosine(34) deaminase TadA [Clostridia bacterium]|nr:tRNA adenosine(34) deaminase TadA [Clostridia bacterium]
MSLHDNMMRLALTEAQKAAAKGEVPVGAVIAIGETVISAAHNLRESTGDPTAHAEVLAIREAAQKLGRRRLNDCTLYVTLEPCPMCAGAMVMACLGSCFFGAKDIKQGCAESVLSITQEPAFYHNIPCFGGLQEEACATLLNDFFRSKRTNQ